MLEQSTQHLSLLIATFGYAAIFFAVAIESTGVPFPGETVLVLAAAYAAATSELQIPFVILAAAGGAIVGDNCGYWLGREGGYRLLLRYGRYVRLDEHKLRIGQYFFWKHGPKVVFLGRFVAILRTWAAFLAGVNGMHWRTFTFFNIAGGLVWAAIFGVGGYTVGANFDKIEAPWYVIAAGAVVVLGGGAILVKKGEARLARAAETVQFDAELPHLDVHRLLEGQPEPVADERAEQRRSLRAIAIFAVLVAGLAFGCVELWLLSPTPFLATVEPPDVGDWGWAFSAVVAWRSVALAVAALVCLVAVVVSLTRKRNTSAT